jgi:hypothetical protein
VRGSDNDNDDNDDDDDDKIIIIATIFVSIIIERKERVFSLLVEVII